jgi:hypothetical protein
MKYGVFIFRHTEGHYVTAYQWGLVVRSDYFFWIYSSRRFFFLGFTRYISAIFLLVVTIPFDRIRLAAAFLLH